MNYIDAFRDKGLAQHLAERIHAITQSGRTYGLMEFCGGHTHAIARFGIPDLLPQAIRLIHGPGCPVCVLPAGRIDQAIELALREPVTLCTYGDTLRVPASDKHTLAKAKAMGADVRMVHSPLAALQLAVECPERQVVFLAIGFETTAAPTAAMLAQAEAQGLQNLTLLSNLVLTPAAMEAVLSSGHNHIQGIIGPAHVSIVIGSQAYQDVAARYQQPVVVAGFEPLDVLQAIESLVRQINEGRCEVDNQYTRAVSERGNRKAQAMLDRFFETRPFFDWRGLGSLPHSGLTLKPEWKRFDAESRYGVRYRAVPDHKSCDCAAIVRGEKSPEQCRIFGTGCTPDHPIGACMVSSEGACAAHYTYGRFRTTTTTALN